ncbi:phosphatidylserine/phosphatidylglycerophosphate/cardiolipin synthase [Ramlibacter sp.]|uniref:phosphatidylserine/phosphatidylglycerophosphate/ cardiolipin synthase n=1 Tax=Ramlibacter sp. TaxID=1917967 RepID=UPI00261D6151|nr:phosphatidylserine/phosphatidylglycerophosphate/cardiolipin synthase [Ramlibacter sp.]
MIGRVDPASNKWIGAPAEQDAADVASLIATGDDVLSIFIIPGGTVLGAKFRRVTYQDGAEGIELEDEAEGRRVADLARGD